MGTKRGAGRDALGTAGGNQSGLSLIAVLCAGALAPLVVAGDPLGPLAAAGVGLASSVGGNVLTDVVSSAIAKLRGQRGEHNSWEPAALELALAAGLEEALAGAGPGGAAMREIAAGILRESGTLSAVVNGAAGADPDALVALSVGFAQLGEQFGEFAFLAADLRTAVVALRRESAAQAADRRADAERSREQGVVLERILAVVDHRSATPAEPVWVGCPYPGLAPFGERDARVFYGRGAILQRLVDVVAERMAAGGGFVVMLWARRGLASPRCCARA